MSSVILTKFLPVCFPKVKTYVRVCYHNRVNMHIDITVLRVGIRSIIDFSHILTTLAVIKIRFELKLFYLTLLNAADSFSIVDKKTYR